MSNADASGTEANVKAKVVRIERQMDELKSATRTAVWVGRLVLLIITIVILLQVLSVYNIFKNLDRDAYVTAAQKEMEGLLPKVYDQAGSLAENVAPVYQKAMLDEFNSAMPEIAETVSREMDFFVANVGDNVHKSLEERFRKVLDKQLEIIAKDMPEIKDQERRQKIMDGVLDCAYGAAQHFSNDLFKPQIDALADLNATIESVEIPAQFRQMSDSQLLYQTTNRLGDLLIIKMAILEDVFVEPVKNDIQGK